MVWSVAFSPDSQRIVTGSWDNTAKLWETGSGRELLTLKAHTDWITTVSFSADGLRIVTGSFDDTAKVWEAASPEQVTSWRKEEHTWAKRFAELQRERSKAGKRKACIQSDHG